MNWLTKLIPKKKRNISYKGKDIPDNLWLKCPSCEVLLFRKDINSNLHICTNCRYHFFLPPKNRFELLFDSKEYIALQLPLVTDDPLKFFDSKKYTDRLKSYREKTGNQDALLTSFGKVNGILAVVSVMDFTFMGGSMGSAVGHGIVFSINQAIERNVPYIIVTASGGARMQEGMLTLMQMPRTIIALEKLKNAKLPYIVILTKPTTGGVTASFAMLGDFHIAEQGATIGFAGLRVIEQTIKSKLPENFQTAEYLLEHGMVDIVVDRKDLKEKLGTLLNILQHT